MGAKAWHGSGYAARPVPTAPHFWTTGSFGAAARSEDASESAHSGLIERPTSGQVRVTAKLRVLVVEPAAVLRNIMAHALAVQGYEVQVLERIAGLEQRVAVFDPHVVVTEAALPDGSGEQVCKRVQAQGQKLVPVILMSGAPESELQSQAKAVGADRHFCKARGLSQLLDLVEELTSEIVF